MSTCWMGRGRSTTLRPAEDFRCPTVSVLAGTERPMRILPMSRSTSRHSSAVTSFPSLPPAVPHGFTYPGRVASYGGAYYRVLGVCENGQEGHYACVVRPLQCQPVLPGIWRDWWLHDSPAGGRDPPGGTGGHRYRSTRRRPAYRANILPASPFAGGPTSWRPLRSWV